jgi:tetratricopeptide (TPR) repeat protein
VLEGLGEQDFAEVSAHQLLGVALQRRATCLMEMRNTVAAEQDISQSEAMLTKLYKDNSNNLKVLRDLADCYRAKGNLAARRSRSQDATRAYQQSLDLWQRWLQIGKTSVFDQRQRELALHLVRNSVQHKGKPRA